MMVAVLSRVLGDSWRKYTAYLIAILILVHREEIGLVQGRETEDIFAIAAFAFFSAAYLVGQGLADWGKSASLIERDFDEATARAMNSPLPERHTAREKEST